MNGYGWVRPAGFLLTMLAAIVTVARWTSHIDGQLDMLSYQVNQVNNQVSFATNKLEAQADQVRVASEQSRQAAQSSREQQRSMKQMNTAIDSLTFRVRQIEEHLKMYGGSNEHRR